MIKIVFEVDQEKTTFSFKRGSDDCVIETPTTNEVIRFFDRVISCFLQEVKK